VLSGGLPASVPYWPQAAGFLVILFVTEAVEEPLTRGLGLLLLLLLMATTFRPQTAPESSGARLAVLLCAALPFAMALLSLGTRHRIRLITGTALAAFILLSEYLARPPPRLARLFAHPALPWLLAALALVVPLISLASGVLVPKGSDVPERSLDAVRALLAGENFYRLNMDAFGADITGDARFGGYKYGPLLAMFYLPFVLTLGRNGILAGNLVVYAATILLTARLAARLGGNAAAAALLVTACPIMAAMTLTYLANDPCPLPLMLLAALCWARAPFLAGLLLGASVSLKLLPGLLALALFLPAAPRLWPAYAAGALIGLAPNLAWLAAGPAAFIDNMVLFSFRRPPHGLSWTIFLPDTARALLGALGIAAWLGLALAAWHGDWSLRQRLGAYVAATLILLLTAKINQGNYWVWFIPAFAVLLATPPRDGAAHPG